MRDDPLRLPPPEVRPPVGGLAPEEPRRRARALPEGRSAERAGLHDADDVYARRRRCRPAIVRAGGRARPPARPQPRAGLAHALARSRRGDLQVATKRRSELEIAATLDADEADAPRRLLGDVDVEGG